MGLTCSIPRWMQNQWNCTRKQKYGQLKMTVFMLTLLFLWLFSPLLWFRPKFCDLVCLFFSVCGGRWACGCHQGLKFCEKGAHHVHWHSSLRPVRFHSCHSDLVVKQTSKTLLHAICTGGAKYDLLNLSYKLNNTCYEVLIKASS